MKETAAQLHQRIAAFAQSVLERHGLLQLPVDVKALAEMKGIVVSGMPPDVVGISGMLARAGNTFGIMYATYTDNEGHERFSIGHELGHYFLEGHVDQISFRDGLFHESHAGFVSDEPFEREADYFAAALLIPTKLAKQELKAKREGLPSIQHLRKRANASFTAAAIRYARITDDPVAVICTVEGRVQFCFPSDGLKEVRKKLWLEPGTVAPDLSATTRMARADARDRVGKRAEAEGCLTDWFPETKPLPIREEVVGLGYKDRVMTIISATELDDEEEESDEDMEERWTARFR